MSLEAALFTALKTLVGNRVTDEFPQPPLRPTWPAIRYRISTNPIQDICGDGDDSTAETTVQLDVVAADYEAARALRLLVITAMRDFSPPARLVNSFPLNEPETKTKREVLIYEIYGSS